MKFYYIRKEDAKQLSELCHSCENVDVLEMELTLAQKNNKLELDEIKKICDIGDRILVKFDGKYIPWIIVAKRDDGNIIINSEDCLESRRFDKSTNNWKDSEIRHYLNGKEFKARFDKEFLKCVKTADVHTEDYVTKDDFWLLSHEEVNCPDDRKSWFKPNRGAIRFPYFTDNDSRIKKIYED